MRHEIIIKDLADIDRAAEEFLREIGDNRLIAFFAPMGAGKTTFTSAICRRLGVREDAVSSPTFAIVNEYRTASGEMMYHFDFYRITKTSEALDIGFYDYVDSGCLCIMEWPENVEEILPEETLKVYIRVNQDNSRTVYWED
ncbi:MAG: tRNA (adenosine(37)-N6)-threonylcarbamoyltransferase complex ATPase subunit type 1 TsaE [Bacteroidales bacterium]|nr:tRNA (adenosine(37)-N6)-threonylcarbamoyltransferase complex ATPase subunit type 1 TsaE [Bacteroidales bacterium]MEE3406740.1 tRNA (adenosine(37)-N6)-threonylcarbamoyltransferase complex ATPase subunit type 1 TsaE [Candidatus Cryptobacteroides sp.]SKC34599.1 tRNA threonylcarbamoyladenosine biosynthesis protein TsaE [Bacteroidales bacterium WCE2008]MBO7366045.1 tRNA (adenosine(37)-N6)-threonylcarbamoyltransferase complex ATPase subunit type 1 TsaE [Bacteroidales bacterium]MBO7623545.1 tRNA (a